jgi:transposase
MPPSSPLPCGSSPNSTGRSTNSARWWPTILADTRPLISTSANPGSAPILAARILGEFGDDQHRFADAKARKNYAGSSPITKASGTKRIVLTRYARNKRLGDAVHQWAFCSLRGSPGATAYYQALRSRNIGHQAALRQLANRLVGILHGCLKTGNPYDEHTAWSHHTHAAA